MDTQKAIEYFSGKLERTLSNRIRQAYEAALEALEKQLPKEGIKEKITEGIHKGLHNFYCPICHEKGNLSNKCNVGEYCSDCGQKIKWEERDNAKDV